MILNAIQDLIVATPAISSRLGQWDFGSGGMRPAVFTQDPAPLDCPNPVVVLTQIASEPWGTRGRRGAELTVSARIWGDKQMSDRTLRKLANQMWRALDRAQVSAEDGYTALPMIAEAPTQISDSEGFPGFVVNLRVKTIEE